MSEGFQFSPELLQAMVDADTKTNILNVKTFFEGSNVKSPREILNDSLNEIYLMYSDQLKKMEAAALTRSAKNCYKDKWISDDWTNLEQINHCKNKVRDKILGDFEERLHNTRNENKYTFEKCLHDARSQTGLLYS